MKRLIFTLISFTPLISGLCIFIYYIFFTSLPYDIYLNSARNLYFDCLTLKNEKYIYEAIDGTCKLNNIEYSTVLSHFKGRRNPEGIERAKIALLGDSHTHGLGVNDNETFSSILRDKYAIQNVNLGIGSYATMRELESLVSKSPDSEIVVIQYCDNDAGENDASLRLSKDEFLIAARNNWLKWRNSYFDNKSNGLWYILQDTADRILNAKTVSRKDFFKKIDLRKPEDEANSFANILALYEKQLAKKRIIVFESSGYGLNSSEFASKLREKVSQKTPSLNVTVIDINEYMDNSDYYTLDDHMNKKGHETVAKMLKEVILDINH